MNIIKTFNDIQIHEILISKDNDGSFVINIDYSLLCSYDKKADRKRTTIRDFTPLQIDKLTQIWTAVSTKIKTIEQNNYNNP